MAKHIVTFAPPTPNGGLHVGHLSGPYLAADVYCRAFRLLGDEVVFVSYNDEYQSYLSLKAAALGLNNTELSEQNYHKIKNALLRCHIQPDNFARSKNQPAFLQAVEMFRRNANEYICLKTDQVPYCESCGIWGFEAYARGNCNLCGAISDRSQCENCATAPEISGLSDVKCSCCQQPVSYREIEREYLILDQFRDCFTELSKRPGIRPPLREYLNQQLQQPSLLWPIDRPGESGAPVQSAKNELLSTWFCGVAGYYAATDELGKSAIWQQADYCAFFVGFDCSFSHAVVYPALLKASNMVALDNLTVYTNAFLKLDGIDFSTSRGIAIWANDLLARVNADYVRFYLSAFSPETETANFQTEHFCQYLEQELYVPLDQCLQRCKLVNAQSLVSYNTAELNQAISQTYLAQWHQAVRQQHSMKTLTLLLKHSLDKLADADHNAWQSLNDFTAWLYMAYPIMPYLSCELLKALGLSLDDGQAWLNGEQAAPPQAKQFISEQVALPVLDIDANSLKALYQEPEQL